MAWVSQYGPVGLADKLWNFEVSRKGGGCWERDWTRPCYPGSAQQSPNDLIAASAFWKRHAQRLNRAKLIGQGASFIRLAKP